MDFNQIHTSYHHPFGMMMPGRTYQAPSTEGHRFGFNGQEGDDELKGDGNSWNYKYRMYDSRLCRFSATDPLESDYPYYTPYSFAANQPIHALELEGLESSDDKNPTKTEAEVYNDITLEFLDFLDPLLEFLDDHWIDEDKTSVDIPIGSGESDNAGKLEAKAYVQLSQTQKTTYIMSEVNDNPGQFVDPATGIVSGTSNTEVINDVTINFSVESSQIVRGIKLSETVVATYSITNKEIEASATSAMGLPSFGIADKVLQNKTTHNFTTSQTTTLFGLEISTPYASPVKQTTTSGLLFGL